MPLLSLMVLLAKLRFKPLLPPAGRNLDWAQVEPMYRSKQVTILVRDANTPRDIHLAQWRPVRLEQPFVGAGAGMTVRRSAVGQSGRSRRGLVGSERKGKRRKKAVHGGLTKQHMRRGGRLAEFCGCRQPGRSRTTQADDLRPQTERAMSHMDRKAAPRAGKFSKELYLKFGHELGHK